ncbi:hypothetical protein BC828DRAFT_388142 [Blastocladiella britannica]|nr:hypothetical protein BC828DRAFT_388142 [Blastocladiella britannica]
MPGHVPRHPTRGHGGGRISLPTLGGSNNAKRAGSYNPMARSLSPLDPLSAIDEFEARRAVPSGGATGSSKLSPLKPGSAGSSSAAAAAAAVSALTAATNDAFDHEVIDVIEPPSPTRKAIAALPKPPAPREVPAAEVQSFLAVRVPLDHATHLQLLQAEFPSEKLARESADYASRIRTRKEEEELLRLERDRERRKAFLQHQRQQSERLEAEAEASLLARLSRQSTHERRITRQLQAVRNEKAVMTRNRAFREQQYAEQRERDYADALLREAEAADRHRSDYDAQTALLHMQYSSLVDQRNRERADRHAAMCRSIMDDLLYLSFKVVDYMKINDGMLPDSLLREWKVLFVHAKPVGLKYLTDPTKDAIPVDVEPMQLAQIVDVDPDRLSAASVSNGGAPDERTIALLDEAEFGQYLEGREGWAYRRGYALFYL